MNWTILMIKMFHPIEILICFDQSGTVVVNSQVIEFTLLKPITSTEIKNTFYKYKLTSFQTFVSN